MPSATLAESRLSRPASSATANAAESRSLTRASDTLGNDGAGRPSGRVPMRPTVMPLTPATTVATTTASSEPGIFGWRRADVSITAATTSTSTSDAAFPAPASASPTARIATAAVFSPAGFGTPSAVGTCCRKMITAMPMVKPSTTGHGM